MPLRDSFSLKYGSPLHKLFDIDTNISSSTLGSSTLGSSSRSSSSPYKKFKTPISVKNNYYKPLIYIFIAILIGLLMWFLIYSLTNKDKDEENI